MKTIALIFLLVLLAVPFATAAETEDTYIGGVELDKVLNFGSALLATALFVVTLLAYKRSKNKRLIFVSAAFALFALKGFILSLEMFLGDMPWTDIVASSLDFVILLTFFVAIVRK